MTLTARSSAILQEQFEAFVAEDPTIDRWALYAACRDEMPIFRSESLDAYVLTRHADVMRVLKDPDSFATLDGGPGSTVYGRSILQMRGSEHAKKSGVAAKRLRSSRAAQDIEEFVRDTCARLAGELPRTPDVVELKTDYCMWIPLLAIGKLMDVDHGATQFRQWYHVITAGSMSSMGHPDRRERALAAVAELSDYLAPIIAERRLHPGDDIISDYCTTTYDGNPVPDEEIVAMSALLLTAGVETTERVLTSLFRYLFEHPDLWAELRADRSAVESVAAEALRFMPPVHAVTRRALIDTEIHGVAIHPADRFFVLIASANRDSEVFEDPDVFDPYRFMADAARQFTQASRILPFGAGRHHCTGSGLVRVEMRHSIDQLLQHVDHATFADGHVPADAGFILRSPDSLRVELCSGQPMSGPDPLSIREQRAAPTAVAAPSPHFVSQERPCVKQ